MVLTDMVTMDEIIITIQVITGVAMVIIAILPPPPNIVLATEATVP